MANEPIKKDGYDVASKVVKKAARRSRFSRFINDTFSETDADRANEASFDPPQPFIAHFIALRDCVVKSGLAWVLCMLLVAPFAPNIIEWLKAPLMNAELNVKVVGLEVGVGFSLFMTTMLWGGTILALPAILYFVFSFIFPGLRRHERNLICMVLGVGILLFFLGASLCYGFTLTLAMKAFMSLNAWMGVSVDFLQVNDYIGFVLKMILAFGLAFQFPLVLLALGWLGLISSKSLRKHRGGVIIFVFVVAMFLTPPDPLSQIVMAVPMCLLYELTIWLIRLKEVMAATEE
ncbi:MAG: twin-arginine translocase subunit TatC [bacterium]|nr:twin-arginine translocase subunit TatC [bacterium]